MSNPEAIYGPGVAQRQRKREEELGLRWPEGVQARYLTVGGATVDITHDRSSATARCNGCTDSDTRDWMDDDSSYNPEAQERMAKEDTRRWAQNHSSTCRAMPTPGGAL